MKLLNLCAGANRPQTEEWTNLDYLLPVLGRWSPEWANLQQEKNYIEFDVTTGPLPFEENTFDGILASHCLEHWDCQQGVRIMADCRRILKPGGILLVSVPDATYFRAHYEEDTVENAERLFGEPIHLPDGETTFFGYGLWNRHHKAILTEDALWAYFKRAGFAKVEKLLARAVTEYRNLGVPAEELVGPVKAKMFPLLNRIPFSLAMGGIKE